MLHALVSPFFTLCSFTPPCENYLLAVTGFADSDRDWLKLMIEMVGAKYTGCLTKHNNALICFK